VPGPRALPRWTLDSKAYAHTCRHHKEKYNKTHSGQKGIPQSMTTFLTRVIPPSGRYSVANATLRKVCHGEVRKCARDAGGGSARDPGCTQVHGYYYGCVQGLVAICFWLRRLLSLQVKMLLCSISVLAPLNSVLSSLSSRGCKLRRPCCGACCARGGQGACSPSGTSSVCPCFSPPLFLTILQSRCMTSSNASKRVF